MKLYMLVQYTQHVKFLKSKSYPRGMLDGFSGNIVIMSYNQINKYDWEIVKVYGEELVP